jgi:SAM-dependent methyltransferase
LELGAGTGKNFPHYGPAARVIASDLAWAMLARARRRLRPPIRALLLADASHLPIRDAAIDTVTATFVCCVQADPRPALGEIARVLRPEGQALFLEYALPPHGWLRPLMRLLESPLRILYGVRWEHDLPALLAAAGLPVARVQAVWAPVVQAIVAAKAAGAGFDEGIPHRPCGSGGSAASGQRRR